MFLKSKDLDYQGFSELLAAVGQDDFRFFMQGTLKEYIFDFFQKEKLKPEETDSLILFSPEGELKVRRIGKDTYRAVYLGSKDFRPDWENFAADFDFSDGKKVKTILWGKSEGNQDFFVEQTIPHYFNYPVCKLNSDKTKRTVLIQEVFYDDFGNISFVRNCELEVKTEEELCL